MVNMDYDLIIMRMAELGINFKQLAERMGVSPTAVCVIMKRKGEKSRLLTAAKFAKALGIPISDVVKA